jgi:hypothetical protein
MPQQEQEEEQSSGTPSEPSKSSISSYHDLQSPVLDTTLETAPVYHHAAEAISDETMRLPDHEEARRQSRAAEHAQQTAQVNSEMEPMSSR